MRRLAMASLALLFIPGAGRADPITLGGSDGTGAPWPFGSGVRFQQVFDSTLFHGTWNLNSITFYNRVEHSAEGFVEPATYRFFLSTTPTSSATLTTSYEANLGNTTTRVREWTVTEAASVFFDDSLTLAFTTPFFFDPRSGNLLLDVRKDMSAEHGDGPIYLDAALHSIAGVSMVGNVQPRPPFSPEEDHLFQNSGLLVSFDGTFTPFDAAPVPEPTSMFLAGVGLAVVARSVARRK